MNDPIEVAAQALRSSGWPSMTIREMADVAIAAWLEAVGMTSAAFDHIAEWIETSDEPNENAWDEGVCDRSVYRDWATAVRAVEQSS